MSKMFCEVIARPPKMHVRLIADADIYSRPNGIDGVLDIAESVKALQIECIESYRKAKMTNQEELDEILDEMQMANPGGELKAQEEAKSAIDVLTLTQILALIGEDELELPYDGQPETEMKNANIRSRNRLRDSQRKSAERIWS